MGSSMILTYFMATYIIGEHLPIWKSWLLNQWSLVYPHTLTISCYRQVWLISPILPKSGTLGQLIPSPSTWYNTKFPTPKIIDSPSLPDQFPRHQMDLLARFGGLIDFCSLSHISTSYYKSYVERFVYSDRPPFATGHWGRSLCEFIGAATMHSHRPSVCV